MGDILRIILSGLEGHRFDELSLSFPASDEFDCMVRITNLSIPTKCT